MRFPGSKGSLPAYYAEASANGPAEGDSGGNDLPQDRKSDAFVPVQADTERALDFLSSRGSEYNTPKAPAEKQSCKKDYICVVNIKRRKELEIPEGCTDVPQR